MCCWRLLQCARRSKRNSTAQNSISQRSGRRSEEEKKKVDRICKGQARQMGAYYQFQNLLGSFQARRFCTPLCGITWANQRFVASSDNRRYRDCSSAQYSCCRQWKQTSDFKDTSFEGEYLKQFFLFSMIIEKIVSPYSFLVYYR